MTTTEQAVKKLVMDILARGRLQQQEIKGKLLVRDMGINVRKKQFEEDILRLINEARVEAIDTYKSELLSQLKQPEEDYVVGRMNMIEQEQRNNHDLR